MMKLMTKLSKASETDPIAESTTLTFADMDLMWNRRVAPSNEGMAAELAVT